MTGEALDRAAVALLSLVCDDWAHQRRFADNTCARAHARTDEVGDQAPDAETADFLVVSARKVQRCLEAPFHELRDERQRDADEALHVGSTASVEPAFPLHQLERVGRPDLAFYWHDVGVARKYDSRLAPRTQRREQVGLTLLVVVCEPAISAESFEIAAHELNEREIGIAAHGRKSDQPADHLEGDR